ncbi:hypothetical protein QBC46DRAFT_356093 [Diplogelasinospora grovesii]|uniref:Uncharacterized protein n=1 Tax=Diplogelasinospora grovesii TaxID=303347 RepID=A0AAN6S2L0_9PEZI|nr:hypothetical protein QBC46DRAFT_356093 [Diplogelasinospora grovesii]
MAAHVMHSRRPERVDGHQIVRDHELLVIESDAIPLTGAGDDDSEPALQLPISIATLTSLLLAASSTASAWRCYGSGQWGKLSEGDRAVADFCSAHATAGIPSRDVPMTGSYRYNDNYPWDISVKTSGSNPPPFLWQECRDSLFQALSQCKGNNADTRGGNGDIRSWYISIDPNTKLGLELPTHGCPWVLMLRMGFRGWLTQNLWVGG